jgi:plasmid maintenance system antidote protein VapI
MSFYAQNNPTKATTEFVEKTLLKYQGREEQLFTKLQRKYEAKEIRRKARERAEEEDAKLKQRGSNVEE